MIVFLVIGMSQKCLFGYIMVLVLLVVILVVWLSLFLVFQGINQFVLLLNKQDILIEFDILVLGCFQVMCDGIWVIYIEELLKDCGELVGIFILQKDFNSSNQECGIFILVVEKGIQNIQVDGSCYLILYNGYCYDGNFGQVNYWVIQYDIYGVMLFKFEVSSEVSECDVVFIVDLFGSDNLCYQVELQWCLLILLLVFVVILLVVLLLWVNLCQGCFFKLLLVIFFYMGYLVLLIVVCGQLDKGKIFMVIGLWWVYGLFLVIGFFLFYWEFLCLKLVFFCVGCEVVYD